jgi:hypothetical protein
MFDYNSMTVIYLRMFLSLLAENIARVNKELTNAIMLPMSNGAYTQCLLFSAGALRVTLVLEGEIYSLHLTTGTTERFIKLGKSPHISKSVLNQLEVWFHREHRGTYNEAIDIITQSVNLVNIKPFVNAIGWFKRLIFGQNVQEIHYGDSNISSLMKTRVVVQRGIFNRLQVFIETHTGDVSGLFTKLVPVHAGIMRTYHANTADTSLNRWIRGVLLEHVERHLK